jgi:putative DNA primase/helicase
MKRANARDFVGEALAANDIQPEGHVSSDDSNNYNGAGDGNSGDSSPVGFTMEPKSGLFVEIIKKGESETEWIAAPFEVVGRVRDPNSESWARLLRWSDDDGRVHEHTVSDADLHNDVGALCARLASLGLKIVTGPARAYLIRYLNQIKPKARVTKVQRTGWHEFEDKSIFVLPGRHQDGNRAIIVEGTAMSPYDESGTLEEWQRSVGELIAGHRLPMFGVATALASPQITLW